MADDLSLISRAGICRSTTRRGVSRALNVPHPSGVPEGWGTRGRPHARLRTSPTLRAYPKDGAPARKSTGKLTLARARMNCLFSRCPALTDGTVEPCGRSLVDRRSAAKASSLVDRRSAARASSLVGHRSAGSVSSPARSLVDRIAPMRWRLPPSVADLRSCCHRPERNVAAARSSRCCRR